MAIVPYLAMTAGEIAQCPPHSPNPVWLAPCDPRLWTNFSLSEGSILAITDQIPVKQQDIPALCDTLSKLVFRSRCQGILLDFQHPGSSEYRSLAKRLTDILPCPVAVSDLYAQPLNSPVFLSPVPPCQRLSSHIAAWTGREIWLDISTEAVKILLTPEGSTFTALPHYVPTQKGHKDETLHSHYAISVDKTSAVFTLWRTKEDLESLLQEAESFGISKVIGLYQELNGIV